MDAGNLAVTLLPLNNLDPERSLLQYLELYLALEVAAARSAHTQAAKQRDLQLFVEWYYQINGHGRIHEWIRRDTRAYIEHLRLRSRPSTVNRRMATLKHFAKFCSRLNAFPLGDPTARTPDLPLEPLRPRSFTRPQMYQLYKAADILCQIRTHSHAMPQRDRAILWIMSQTGMRVSSLVSLDLAHLQGRYLRNVPTKGGRIQDHFLPQQSRDMLDIWLDQRGMAEGALFWSQQKIRLDRTDVRLLLERIAAQASVGQSQPLKISPHMLRHTVAQELCDKYGESFAIEKLGHSSSRYIRRYLKRPEEVEEKMLEEALGM